MGKITPRSTDYSEWYLDVIREADMADYAPVRGCIVVKPYGWTLYENMRDLLDRRFKDTGHSNAAFPLFIPMSFLQKEAHHVEGFSPELAVVTVGGGEQLEEPLVVRPTSETIIGYMYAQWIKSYRDLPVLINQWNSVVRWEKRTKPFLRTMEFFWQEGHTAHANHEESMEEVMRMLEVYHEHAMADCALPTIKGRKSKSERFAGADNTFSIEGMMGDKKALQSATSHDLGQNFAKAFEMKFLDRDNTEKFCWTTSWGLSWRLTGAVIMVHGDDIGLRLPPKIAPIQAMIVPIYKKPEEKVGVMAVADEVLKSLKAAGIRVKLDDREDTPGAKFYDCEMRGIPVRIEIGPRDLQTNSVLLARRDIPGKPGKTIVSRDGLADTIKKLMDEIQANLLAQAEAFQKANIREVNSYDELKEAVETGWALAPVIDDPAVDAKIKEETKATNRNFPLDQDGVERKCIITGQPTRERAIFARAY
ncbi:MAG: proline--tRNA ligase [Anaerolineae bacterium]|nr:proline--tRNA ligase [Anaerolineae bacterium]